VIKIGVPCAESDHNCTQPSLTPIHVLEPTLHYNIWWEALSRSNWVRGRKWCGS